jgi:MFS family permease/preprotein translocase subunit SecG
VTPVTTTPSTGAPERITFYHWLVVVIASAGWLFDCMDQRFFTMARLSALKDLLGNDAQAQAHIENYLNWATAAMMLGWGIGGIFFGTMSDRWGRVKTMVATLLVYSGFTGLSGFAHGWVDFIAFRFLVGLGVGGMFGAATTLVAESVPSRIRTAALGSLQALSAIGNLTATLISKRVPPGAESIVFGDDFVINYPGWRLLFFVGILPSLLAVPIIFVLREPEAWKQAKAAAQAAGKTAKVGSIAALFSNPTWRRHTLVGLGLGVAGMMGLWGIGFFSPELVTTALKTEPLRVESVLEPQRMLARLASPTNPAARYLSERLPADVRPALNTTNADAAATQTVVAALNALIHGPSLYDSNAFASIILAKGTVNLLSQVALRPREGDLEFLNRQLVEQALPGCITSLQARMDNVRSDAMMLFDVGALLGMFSFTFIAAWFNRRTAFLLAFVFCLVITIYVFSSLKTAADAYWMLPILGFAQLAVFAGYSIYFPELYPTRLRGTGVGFCYNTVRFFTVPLLLLMGALGSSLGLRQAAMIMAFVYVIGIVALIWAPETKGKPLPED